MECGQALAFHHMVRLLYLLALNSISTWTWTWIGGSRVSSLMDEIFDSFLFLLSLWIRSYLGVMGVELSSICVV